MRFEILGEISGIEPSPQGLAFARSPGCAKPTGGAAGANARGSLAWSWPMALSIQLKYT